MAKTEADAMLDSSTLSLFSRLSLAVPWIPALGGSATPCRLVTVLVLDPFRPPTEHQIRHCHYRNPRTFPPSTADEDTRLLVNISMS